MLGPSSLSLSAAVQQCILADAVDRHIQAARVEIHPRTYGAECEAHPLVPDDYVVVEDDTCEDHGDVVHDGENDHDCGCGDADDDELAHSEEGDAERDNQQRLDDVLPDVLACKGCEGTRLESSRGCQTRNNGACRHERHHPDLSPSSKCRLTRASLKGVLRKC